VTPKSVSELVALLSDKDKDVRIGAATELEARTSGMTEAEVKAAVPVLIRALKDQEAEVRRRAANALGKIGEEAKAAVPALIVALTDKEGHDAGMGCYAHYYTVGNAAAQALLQIDPEAATAAGVPPPS
jgi:HEAT repeat protein